MWPKITKYYSPNFTINKRTKKQIKFLIIHYTGMRKEFSAIERLCDFKSEVSAHYFIKKDGSILNLVPDLYEAWHAGISSWKNKKSLNRCSIGIEIQNSGHDNLYENYSLKQIKSLKNLLRYLIRLYKINLNNILGHSDIAPLRKKDPGEKFPWKELARLKLARWHSLDKKKLNKLKKLKLDKDDENLFMKNLYKIGYSKINSRNSNIQKRLLVKAFQRRFRQNLVNGFSDQECLLISKNLLKS